MSHAGWECVWPWKGITLRNVAYSYAEIILVRMSHAGYYLDWHVTRVEGLEEFKMAILRK